VAIWSTLPTYAGNQGFRAKPTMPPTPDLSRPLPRDRNYAAWDGTSMASPHVAGAAALVLAKLGNQTGAQVKARLQGRAVKVAGMGGQSFTQEYGSGRLDLYKLLG
jgi:subtilisin family serine protease